MSDLPDSAFNLVPADTRRQGFYPEIEDSGAGTFQSRHTALLIGQKLAAGTATAGDVVTIPGDGRDAVTLFGRGSQLALAVAAFRQNNRTTELRCLPLADNGAGTAATLDVTFGGTATEAGVIAFYVDGVRVQIPVAVGDDGSALAAAAETALAAALDLPVTAAATLAVLAVTHRHKGLIGNETRLQVNLRGSLGGEKLPAGVTVTIPGDGYLAGGAANPDIAGAVAGMGDIRFHYIGYPWTDTASMDGIEAELTRRWAPEVRLRGQAFNGFIGTPGARQSFGQARNGKFNSTIRSYAAPGPAWMKSARYLAQCAFSLANHPARPLNSLPLIGEIAEPESARPLFTDDQTDLYAGIATDYVGADGTVRIGRAISNYQKNASGVADNAWLDITTPATLTRICEELEFLVTSEFIDRRCILVDDDEVVAPGLPVCSPRSIRAALIAHYEVLQRQGIVEDLAQFKKGLIVARSDGDPARVNILYTPDLANPLYIVAVQVAFALN